MNRYCQELERENKRIKKIGIIGTVAFFVVGGVVGYKISK